VRILYHHRTQAEDGQAVHIRSLQRAFREEGHQVHEFALVRRDPGAGAEAARRPTPWALVARAPRFVRELAEYAYGPLARGRLLAAARLAQADFLYERYAFGNTAGVFAAHRLGIPLVLEVNSPMVLELARTRGLGMPRLAGRVERWIFRSADLVCVVTDVLRGMLAEMGVARERLLVTPNGVDLERYLHPEPRAARAELGLPADPGGPVLGFVGYVRDWHRLDLVIEALRAPPLSGARLVLVGQGPAIGALVEQARRAGVEARLHLAGACPHDRVPALLPAFDVALVPAINPYASPLKLFEYMAAGLAVVAPDQPNLREVLADGDNALLFPPGDGPALAAALGRLAAAPDLRARLGRAARASVEQRDLTWRANARRVVAAVDSLGRRG
jgi:glycosyltransferase involved in cell wall biosynthesis